MNAPVRRKRRLTAASAVLVFAVGFAADQSAKAWALANLADGTVIPIVPTVSLQLAFNPGVAFSLGAEAGPILPVGILIILIGLTGWIGWSIHTRRPAIQTLLLAVVAAGGWANMWDRFSRAGSGPLSGAVVDYIAVDWFAIFNGADVLAVGGILGYALVTVFSRDSREPAAGGPSGSSGIAHTGRR